MTGALSGFYVSTVTGNPWLGLGAALISGALLSLIHAVLCISLQANQVVSGLALTIFGTGLCGVLGKSMVGIPGIGFQKFDVPLLAKIPAIGDIFFRHDVIVYISYFLIPLCWVFLFKTKPGLNLRAAGENPHAAETMGLNVIKIRYLYVLVGGALAGLGGAHLSLAYNHQWIDNMSAGRGWIAIALVIFSQWNPWRAALGAYLFGAVDAIQFRIQASGAKLLGFALPASILLMMPYIFTILVLIIASLERKQTAAPEALGVPYVRGERQ